MFTLFAIAAGLLVALGTWALIHSLLHPARKTFAVAIARGLATDPAQLGLRGSEREFELADGSRAPGWVIEGRDALGPVIVVTHGYGDSRYGALTRAPVLAEFASSLLLYDLRAHGHHTAALSKLATIEHRDLFDVLRQLEAQDKPVVLYGSSMGAGISLVAAARLCAAAKADRRAPSPAQGEGRGEGRATHQSMASIQHPKRHDPAARVPHTATPLEGRAVANAVELPAVKLIGVIAEAPYRYPLEPIIGRLWEMKLLPYPFVWLAKAHFAFWHGNLEGFDRALHAPHIACPLLVLHGTADRLCKPASARAIVEAAPRAELVFFDDGEHSDFYQTHATRYREALAHFFATLRGRGEPDTPDTISDAEPAASHVVNVAREKSS